MPGISDEDLANAMEGAGIEINGERPVTAAPEGGDLTGQTVNLPGIGEFTFGEAEDTGPVDTGIDSSIASGAAEDLGIEVH